MTLPIAKIILPVKCIILHLILLCFKLKFHTAHDIYIYLYLSEMAQINMVKDNIIMPIHAFSLL